MVPDRDDKGEAEFFDIFGVQPRELRAFIVGQRIQTGACLFGLAVGGQAFGFCQFASKIRVRC